MFLSILSFYLVRSLSFIGVLIYISLSILIILLNILFTITNIIKTKKIGKLFFLLPILFSTLFSFLIIKNQISEKIALKIEFTKYKKELDRYIADNTKNENIRIFDNYVGIIWDPGFLDNYSVIIYDKIIIWIFCIIHLEIHLKIKKHIMNLKKPLNMKKLLI